MTQNSINGINTLIQFGYSSTVSVVTCSTAMPADDTIPLITEGDEVLTIVFTPKSATSTLEILFVAQCSKDGNNGTMTCALFQDATANALSAKSYNACINVHSVALKLAHSKVSGTTSAITFRVRIGSAANSSYLNGSSAGAARLGGVLSSTLTVMEYL